MQIVSVPHPLVWSTSTSWLSHYQRLLEWEAAEKIPPWIGSDRRLSMANRKNTDGCSVISSELPRNTGTTTEKGTSDPSSFVIYKTNLTFLFVFLIFSRHLLFPCAFSKQFANCRAAAASYQSFSVRAPVISKFKKNKAGRLHERKGGFFVRLIIRH